MLEDDLPRRVVIYTRVSTDHQTVDNQAAALCAFVAAHERWHLVDEYRDTDSGANAERPAFVQLFADAHRRRFDLVVFWSLDRFSREGTRETINYLHELGSYGVDFVSHTERYLDSTGIF